MSLNPFTARREKKEEAVKERIAEFQAQQFEVQQQQQQLQQSAPPSFSLPSKSETDYEAEDFSKYLPASAQVSVWRSRGAWEPSRAAKPLLP